VLFCPPVSSEEDTVSREDHRRYDEALQKSRQEQARVAETKPSFPPRIWDCFVLELTNADHPSFSKFAGLLEDKDPSEVVKERAADLKSWA
jgi:hypothetical protein